MFFTIRSNSAFVTASPFTRASTSGNWAGMGLGGSGAGDCPAAPAAGAALAVSAEVFPQAAPAVSEATATQVITTSLFTTIP